MSCILSGGQSKCTGQCQNGKEMHDFSAEKPLDLTNFLLKFNRFVRCIQQMTAEMANSQSAMAICAFRNNDAMEKCN